MMAKYLRDKNGGLWCNGCRDGYVRVPCMSASCREREQTQESSLALVDATPDEAYELGTVAGFDEGWDAGYDAGCAASVISRHPFLAWVVAHLRRMATRLAIRKGDTNA